MRSASSGPDGRPVFTFDGTDDYFEVANALGFGRNAAALTIATVANPNRTGSDVFSCTTGSGAARAVMLAGTSWSMAGRRLDADNSVLVNRPDVAGWVRAIGTLRYSAAQADIALNGAITTGPFQTAGASQDTDSNAAPNIGRRVGGANYLAGPLAALVLARSALDIPTLDAALAQVMP